jgi:hypothetical protein
MIIIHCKILNISLVHDMLFSKLFVMAINLSYCITYNKNIGEIVNSFLSFLK